MNTLLVQTKWSGLEKNMFGFFMQFKRLLFIFNVMLWAWEKAITKKRKA